MKKTIQKTPTLTTASASNNPPSHLRDRCLRHFAALRIPVEAARLDEVLTQAEKEGFSHLHFLDQLLGAVAKFQKPAAAAS